MGSNQKKHEHRTRCTKNEIEYMLLGVLRDPLLFAETLPLLQVTHFDGHVEKHYRALWTACTALAGRHDGQMPQGNVANLVHMEIERQQGQEANKLSEQERTQLFHPEYGLVAWIWDYPPEQIHRDDVRFFKTEFIRERELDKYNGMVESTRHTGLTPDKRQELEEQWQRVTSISATSSNQMLRPVMDEDILDAAPDNKHIIWSTGLNFVDKFMNGGQRAGEAYTLMGPSGVGKTTLALQMCAEAAREQARLANRNPDEPPGVACYFSFEMQFEDLTARLWSYTAEIHGDTFKNGIRGIRSELSVTSKLKEYELARFRNKIITDGLAVVPGELERLRESIRELRPYLYLADMAGLDPSNRAFGVNGIDDIVLALKSLRDEGRRPGWVAIDYSGLVVDRYMDERGIHKDQKRHYLNQFVLDSIAKIAIPFNVPVWNLHQVNVEGNRRAPGSVIHHSQAAEATAFAHNAWFAFQLGNKDHKDICSLFCTKTRRAAGTVSPPVLQINGAFCRMDDASEQLQFDAAQGKYVDKNALSNRGTSSEVQQAVEAKKQGKKKEKKQGGMRDLNDNDIDKK
jgi:hypothetical protein